VDWKLVIGIGIGAVLSFAASVAANLYSQRINTFLDSRRLSSQSKRKTKAAKFHKLITDFQTGKRDRYLFAVRVAMGAVIGIVMSLTSLTGLAVVASGLPFSFDLIPSYGREDYGRLFWCGSLTFFSLMGMNLFRHYLWHFGMVERALENYAEFDQVFKDRWGSEPDAQPSEEKAVNSNNHP